MGIPMIWITTTIAVRRRSGSFGVPVGGLRMRSPATVRHWWRRRRVGKDWNDPAAMTEMGQSDPAEPYSWIGPDRKITVRTWADASKHRSGC